MKKWSRNLTQAKVLVTSLITLVKVLASCKDMKRVPLNPKEGISDGQFQVLGGIFYQGLPWWLSGKESACKCRRLGFSPRLRKIPWRRKRQPTPVFLPRKSQGQRSLTDYNLWYHKESDMTEQLNHHHCKPTKLCSKSLLTQMSCISTITQTCTQGKY